MNIQPLTLSAGQCCNKLPLFDSVFKVSKCRILHIDLYFLSPLSRTRIDKTRKVAQFTDFQDA